MTQNWLQNKQLFKPFETRAVFCLDIPIATAVIALLCPLTQAHFTDSFVFLFKPLEGRDVISQCLEETHWTAFSRDKMILEMKLRSICNLIISERFENIVKSPGHSSLRYSFIHVKWEYYLMSYLEDQTWHTWTFFNIHCHTLNMNCPLQAHVFEHLVPSWRHCSWRLWKLQEVEHWWRKWFVRNGPWGFVNQSHFLFMICLVTVDAMWLAASPPQPCLPHPDEM